MKKRRTTPKEFKQFQKSFLYWQKKLGLMEWKINFRCQDIGHNYGSIYSNFTGQKATIIMTNSIGGENELSVFNAKECGKHEAIHLLLSPLNYHGHARYIHESDIDTADEVIVRRLEKVLGDK